VEVVQRPEATVLGVEVVAAFDELGVLVPAAWEQVFARVAQLPVPPPHRFAEASRHLGEGRYRETVGVLVGGPVEVPDGMVLTTLPAGRYVRHRHTGPVETIADGFRAAHEWAGQHGLQVGDVKLDVGYAADGTTGPHELFVDVH
jgi:predicted transcriptional regulator YdeE